MVAVSSKKRIDLLRLHTYRVALDFFISLYYNRSCDFMSFHNFFNFRKNGVILKQRLTARLRSLLNNLAWIKRLPVRDTIATHIVSFFTFVRKGVILFALYLVAVTIFYFVGSYQDFIDENLLIIIKTGGATSILLIIFCVVNFLQAVVCILAVLSTNVSERKGLSLLYYISHIAILVILIIIAIAALIFYNSLYLMWGGVA